MKMQVVFVPSTATATAMAKLNMAANGTPPPHWHVLRHAKFAKHDRLGWNLSSIGHTRQAARIHPIIKKFQFFFDEPFV